MSSYVLNVSNLPNTVPNFFDTSKLKKILHSINIAGKEVLPIVEGGKGIGVSSGITAGHFAKAGAIGTFSGVNAMYINENGEVEPILYKSHNRFERHFELVEYGIKSAISQAKRAFDISQGKGKIHMNVLWEMGGAQRVLHGVLEKSKGLISGITCGAGMPYQLGEISDHYKIHFYPIVSSMRAFKILWKRSYENFSQWLGGVVYECPWRAGGHNGLSNAEDPLKPQDPYLRIVELRKFMNEVGLQDTAIIIAGGVWHLKEYEHYLNNPEVGKIAFQFGTRPIYTQESPVSDEWKTRLFTLKEGDVYLNKFSPTGFYSSAVRNNFIQDLTARSQRQIEYRDQQEAEFDFKLEYGTRGRSVFIKSADAINVELWKSLGNNEILKTPDNTIIFVTPETRDTILLDQRECMGCLSQCRFSNWREDRDFYFQPTDNAYTKEGMAATSNGSKNDHTKMIFDPKDWSTGQLPDPRSFCIQKTLQSSIMTPDIENNLMFAGSQAFMFHKDLWYQDGRYVPTIQELVDRICTGY